MFQSHNGAIAALFGVYTFRQVSGSFNPTMVRLLPDEFVYDVVERTVFQSHNGAIAASVTVRSQRGPLVFQSHNGAIAASWMIVWVRRES